METESQQKRQEYLTKLVLMSVFISGFGFAAWIGARIVSGEFRPGIFDFVLLALATYRLGRMVAFDRVMEPLRSPVAHTVPDETGAGDNVEAHGHGVRQALGQMITCPICVGTWIAALLTYALYLFPAPTRLFLFALAAIGLAELLHSLTEALCWSANLARTRTGRELREMRREQSAEEINHLPESGNGFLWSERVLQNHTIRRAKNE